MNHQILSSRLKEYIVTSAKKCTQAPEFPRRECWSMLRKCGTRLWLDTGDMEAAKGLWCAEFESLTTNNTLLNKEIQKGMYDGMIQSLAQKVINGAAKGDEKSLVHTIAFALNAIHGLNLSRQFNAKVSVELHTDLAFDVEQSYMVGRSLWAICPDRFIIKVPLTAAGLLAARRLKNDGIPVNFTLGFSARQNYLAAMFAGPSFVNVFMGRLNAFVHDNGLGSGENIGEKATLSTQRSLSSLRQAGMTRSLLIGASMRDAGQVSSLCGIDVMTMPPKVAENFMAEPPPEMSWNVNQDPDVDCSETFMRSLWEVTPEFKKCVADFVGMETGTMHAEDIERYFRRRGFSDLFPEWSPEQVGNLLDDGKIPVFDNWSHCLEMGTVGLDALMNMSALYSFISDQRALDCRIRSILER